MSISAIWKNTLSKIRQPFTFCAGLHVAVAKGSYCGMHCHPAVEIIYHASGRGSTCVAGRSITFGERSVLVHAPGERHDQTMVDDGEDLCVQISLPTRLCPHLKEGFFLPAIDLPWLIEDIQQLSQTPARPGTFEQSIVDLRATAVLLELIHQAASDSRTRALPPSERHILQAEHYIRRHFASIQSLDEVADQVGITPDHLRHIFKKSRGESLVGHLGKVRVARAKTLLTNSPLLLKQIASLCGFRDEYYFSAAFRRAAGVSPSQYRSSANLVGSSGGSGSGRVR